MEMFGVARLVENKCVWPPHDDVMQFVWHRRKRAAIVGDFEVVALDGGVFEFEFDRGFHIEFVQFELDLDRFGDFVIFCKGFEEGNHAVEIGDDGVGKPLDEFDGRFCIRFDTIDIEYGAFRTIDMDVIPVEFEVGDGLLRCRSRSGFGLSLCLYSFVNMKGSAAGWRDCRKKGMIE